MIFCNSFFLPECHHTKTNLPQRLFFVDVYSSILYNSFTQEVNFERSYRLKITYKTRKLEKVCTIASETEKRYGVEMSEKIHQRIDEIDASDSVEELVQFHIGRCHLLKGKRKGQYAMDLVHPYRLIFEKVDEEIRIVMVIEITDYH